jgi:NADH-quinone oxidoreductase subunit C
MDIGEIQKKLAVSYDAAVGPVVEGAFDRHIEVDANAIDKVAEFLKNEAGTAFDCLSNLSGIDYPDKGHIQVVYDLYSYEHDHSLVLKVNADRNAPSVNTVEASWLAANWLEREVYDLLGVEFAGHSDLRRILLPDDWVGYPLRKDYVEAPEYHGISTVRESILDVPGRN